MRGYLFDRGDDAVDGFFAECDSDHGALVLLVVVDFEAEDVVELALEIFWELSDACPEPGQAIEELGLAVAARRVGFQLVEFGQLGSPLGFQHGEAVPQPAAELFVEAVGIAAAGRDFLGLIEEPALPAADLVEPGSDRLAARLPFLGCSFVGPRQVGLQERTSLLAENAASEEVVDGIQQ